MKRFCLLIFVLAICLLGVRHMLRYKPSYDGGVSAEGTADKTETPDHPTKINGSSLSSLETPPTGVEAFAKRDRELAFLDVMLPYLSTNHLASIVEANKRGVVHAPKTFTELSGLAELVGGILKSGKLIDFYEALKSASEKEPQNLNLLRMMALVSSIQGFKDGEYESNLARLVLLDTNSDVTFPYAQILLEKGDAEASYLWIEKNVSEHPDQAASTLSNALRIFMEAKAVPQKNKVVSQLKETKVDAFQAHCCGKYLYDGGELSDAAFFYQKNAEDEANPFFRESALVRLCQIQIQNGTQDDRTVATLKELATKSNTPAIRVDAHRALIELKVDLPNQRSNSNN